MMRKLFLIVAALLITPGVFAQSPEKMSYQAIVRDSANNLVSSSAVGMRISILQGSESGTAVYVETQTPTTNANGVVSMEIGTGIVVSGNFAAIDWANGPYFIKTETDPAGGTSYSISGASQLLSVPYALYATTADSISGGIIETDPTFTANFDFSGATTGDLLQSDGTKWVKFTPNYIQNLQITGNQLSITNGNTVTLPSGESIWVKDENNIYYNDMNEGQSRMYFHPNGNISYNSDWNGAKFHLFEDNPSDTTRAIDVGSLGGIAIWGNTTAKTDFHWMNTGVAGHVYTETETSGSGVKGTIIGDGNLGIAVRGEAHMATGLNVGVSGVGLSKTGNESDNIGGEFIARGDWNTENGVGTGEHYGVLARANGGGDWNFGVWARAEGSSPNGHNYGGRFIATSQVETDGHHYGLSAVAWNSSFINRGITATASASGQYNFGALLISQGEGHPSEETRNYGVYGRAGNNREANYGVLGLAFTTVHADVTLLTGVSGRVGEDGSEVSNFGVEGTVSSTGNSNIGVGGFSQGSATNTNNDAENIGIMGYAQHADINYAVYAQATGSGGLSNYGIYAVADSAATENYAGFFEGDVVITGDIEILGDIINASAAFKIDHPLDPENKYLVHGLVASPEMMNVYSGNITTDATGFATVKLPDYFEAINTDFRYQLTSIGTFAKAIVKEEIKNNSFVVQTNEPNVKISWQVTAVRNDNYANHNRLKPETGKTQNQKGKYLHPEIYGKTSGERVYKINDQRKSTELIEKKNKAHEANKNAITDTMVPEIPETSGRMNK